MKQFKNLVITGPDEELLALVHAVSANLPADWRRDSDAEARMDTPYLKGIDQGFAFQRDAAGGDPPARLFMHRQSGRLYVSNIVPRDVGGLSMGQYNAILDEFADMLRRNLPSDGQLDMRVTSDEAAITDWVSPHAAHLLKGFSALANMSTGASHPLDFERWAHFLVQVHQEGSTLHSSFLSRWLVEELGWPEDGANDLARDYAIARDLLQAYDEFR